jgi:hypothetical protein
MSSVDTDQLLCMPQKGSSQGIQRPPHHTGSQGHNALHVPCFVTVGLSFPNFLLFTAHGELVKCRSVWITVDISVFGFWIPQDDMVDDDIPSSYPFMLFSFVLSAKAHEGLFYPVFRTQVRNTLTTEDHFLFSFLF